jgi:hypothetical protein
MNKVVFLHYLNNAKFSFRYGIIGFPKNDLNNAHNDNNSGTRYIDHSGNYQRLSNHIDNANYTVVNNNQQTFNVIFCEKVNEHIYWEFTNDGTTIYSFSAVLSNEFLETDMFVGEITVKLDNSGWVIE